MEYFPKIDENLSKMSKNSWKTSTMWPWTLWLHQGGCQRAGSIYLVKYGMYTCICTCTCTRTHMHAHEHYLNASKHFCDGELQYFTWWDGSRDITWPSASRMSYINLKLWNLAATHYSCALWTHANEQDEPPHFQCEGVWLAGQATGESWRFPHHCPTPQY